MKKLGIGLVQYSPVWEKPTESIELINKMIEQTDLKNISLLIFPEMSLTGFTMHSKDFAEELDGVSFIYFMQLAKKLRKHIFAGIIERDEKTIYNSLIHFDERGLVRIRYRKIHPFSYTREEKFFRSGNQPCITQIDKISFGLSICYDLRFPELYRLYAKQRTDILINIANWPDDRLFHWDVLLRARAIENQSYMIGVNRTGNDPFLKYSGHSAVVSPFGNVLAQSSKNEILTVEINIDEVSRIRNKLPFLNDIKLI
jgi:predicted amidohydrolase